MRMHIQFNYILYQQAFSVINYITDFANYITEKKMIHEIGSICAKDGGILLRMWRVSLEQIRRPLQQHSHIAFEIARVDRGNGIYTAGEKEYPMNAGDIFIFASNEQHCITHAGAEGFEITNLHFEPRYLWGGSSDSLSSQNINFCFSHNKSFENRIEALQAVVLTPYFEAIRAELNNSGEEYPLAVKSLLNLMIITLIREFDYSGAEPQLNKDRLRLIRKVLNYIDSNLAGDLSLKAISGIAGMSPNYFSSFFHSVSGITLWDYINARRVDAAVRMITAKNPPKMLETAVRCGFNNTANFNKAFRKVTGMTPTEYRASDESLIR